MSEDQKTVEARKAWMSLLAKAPPLLLEELSESLENVPDFDWLRPPEVGGAMVRGRAGGTGAPFNLGEMTITRCALRLESGQVGHAYVQGRNKDHARRAAVIDALMQTDRALELRGAVLKAAGRSRARSSQASRRKSRGDQGRLFHNGKGRGLMLDDAVTGGFQSPAIDAAQAFRAAMNAIARPGRIETLKIARAPAPVSPAAAALLLTLCDRETPLFLASGHDTDEIKAWVAFHIGAPIVGRTSAQFALGNWEALAPTVGVSCRDR